MRHNIHTVVRVRRREDMVVTTDYSEITCEIELPRTLYPQRRICASDFVLSKVSAQLTLRKGSPIMFSSWTVVRFFSTAPWGEMVRSSEPLVPELPKDDQQEFHFPTKEKTKSPSAKNSKQER